MEENLEKNITADERELFELLKGITSVVAPNVTLRVAGGWVRDKLLGKESNDIDIMVDNMSGEKIARLITDFMGLEGPHVIEANPDASKHLETAGANIPISNGTVFDLDFAMARQEVYHDDSRIPDIKPATAEEDAFRRDLTINSLFYNVTTGQLEDFTGQGLADLQTMTIRTPEAPLKTFQDDPLRIFRTIRFVSRYNGTIDPETYSAMMDPSLREAIQTKVKKERVQEELSKTLKGPNPTMALKLLKETGILRDILEEATKGSQYEGRLAPFDMDQNNPHHELTVWDHTMKVVENVLDFYPEADPERRLIMVLTALMHDFGKLAIDLHVEKDDRTSYHGHEDASEEISNMILKYLRFNNKMSAEVSKLVGQHMRVHQLERNTGASSKALRKFLRRMGEMSLNWVDVMNHTIADAYSKGEGDVPAEVIEKYQAMQQELETALMSMTLMNDTNKVAPILNGREIMDILGVSPGPIVGQVGDFLKDIVDDNPALTKEEAAERVKSQFGSEQPPSDQMREASSCPKHLLSSSLEKIKALIKHKNAVQAMSIVRELKGDFEEDEDVIEEIAKATFDILLLDQSQKDVDVLKPVFESSEKNFFNTKICIPVLGILLLIKTGTKDEVIEEIFERMVNMDREGLFEMLSKLPKSCYRSKLADKLIKRYKS